LSNSVTLKQPKHGNGSAVRAPRARRSHTCAPPAEMREAAGAQPWMWAQRCGLWPPKCKATLIAPVSHSPGWRREGGRVWRHHLSSTAQSSFISVCIERWVDPANEPTHNWILPRRPQTERLLPWNAARAMLALIPSRALDAAQMESVTGWSGLSRRLFAL
jgi:hypothetical protein